MKLADYDSRFGSRSLAIHAYRNPSSVGVSTPPKPGIALGGKSALARVDHGRWIADCPTDGCSGAEFVSLSGQHGFFCCECRNAETGHVPIPVALPDEQTVSTVDAYLSVRPAPAVQNWHPEQPVKELQQENRDHGLRLS